MEEDYGSESEAGGSGVSVIQSATEQKERVKMKEITSEIGIAPLLARYREVGGVLDYIFLEIESEKHAEQLHRNAALAGMVVIDGREAQWAASQATPAYPIENFFRPHWDESKISGRRIDLAEFWGLDDMEPKRWNKDAYSLPENEGYKRSFWYPPYTMDATEKEKLELFCEINKYVLGNDPKAAEIFAWSTDWSTYFDRGHEWWGAFYWTIRPVGCAYIVVVGASASD